MNSATRIILIESDPTYAELVQRLLTEAGEEKVEFQRVDSIDSAIGTIEANRHDLILLDVSNRAERGLDDVDRLLSAAPFAHLVVLAEESHENIAIKSVKRGAQDFLLKSEISFRHLRRAVRFAMERGRNLNRLSTLAIYDDLTGLERRASIQEKFRVAVASAERQDRVVGLILIDLNGFKQINDRYGHHLGDQVLIEVANRLRNAVRRSDTVSRFGGDEFVILATDLRDEQDLEKFIAKIRSSLNDTAQISGHSIPISASLGAVLASLSDIDSFAELLTAADKIMYEEKRGRGVELAIEDLGL